jgi:hypothetical protein
MKKRAVIYAPEALQDLIDLYDRIAESSARAVSGKTFDKIVPCPLAQPSAQR